MEDLLWNYNTSINLTYYWSEDASEKLLVTYRWVCRRQMLTVIYMLEIANLHGIMYSLCEAEAWWGWSLRDIVSQHYHARCGNSLPVGLVLIHRNLTSNWLICGFWPRLRGHNNYPFHLGRVSDPGGGSLPGEILSDRKLLPDFKIIYIYMLNQHYNFSVSLEW